MADNFPETFLQQFHDVDSVRKMTYKNLGKTGLKVSSLSLGTSQLALCYGTEAEEEGIETVVQAVKKGINYIDTAPYYGEGKAECVLGKALQKIPRKTYYLATKVGRYTSNPLTMFDFSAEKVTSGLKESLSRLGVSYVDIIQVHDIEFAPSYDILLKETLPALLKLKESGLAKYIGITGYPISSLKNLLALSKVEINTVLSYCRYTLFDQLLGSYIKDFKNANVGVINAAVLGMGLLTADGPPDWHPAKPHLKELCSQAAQHCKEHGTDLAQLATAFSLSNPDIDTHLIGMPSLYCLQKNLEIVYNGLSDEQNRILDDVMERYFKNLHEKNLESWENLEVEKYWKILNNQ